MAAACGSRIDHEEVGHLVYNRRGRDALRRSILRPRGLGRDGVCRRGRHRRRDGGILWPVPFGKALLPGARLAGSGAVLRRRLLRSGSAAFAGRVLVAEHGRRSAPRAGRSLDSACFRRAVRHRQGALRRHRHSAGRHRLRRRQLCADAVSRPAVPADRPDQHRHRAERLRQR